MGIQSRHFPQGAGVRGLEHGLSQSDWTIGIGNTFTRSIRCGTIHRFSAIFSRDGHRKHRAASTFETSVTSTIHCGSDARSGTK